MQLFKIIQLLTNILIALVVAGEVANFAAYSYAPAILVTPLGAGSVLLGAILASIFLDEKLGVQGSIGCALCIIGSLIIILHSPEEKHIDTVDEILAYAVQPATVSLYLIYVAGPKYGKENMLIYITICSLVGSISVMAVKGFGIALKKTLQGQNQFQLPSTYVFLIVVVVCAVTQMNYFNKALSLFSTNRVTPIYYVFFTTATIVASILLFQGFNDSPAKDVATIFCGFAVIFIGVFQLNYKMDEEEDSSMELTAFASSDSESGGSIRSRKNGASKRHDIPLFNAFDDEELEFDD
ncbi:hypothetical protein HK099_007318 [Clydaea vesicula]|uniref:Magnesium transporter n=1 Tax=Clydaea vesicula TaxID=447962 RepID=A0AAD5U884_9FUNG|nr:hypothetical protein HK099_007318 [Clydaea vesicula]